MSRQFTAEDREKALQTRLNNKENRLKPVSNSADVIAPTSTNKALDDLERQIAQQLRIMNMHRMMNDLSNPKPQMEQQVDYMGGVMKMFEQVNKMQENIRKQYVDPIDDAEEEESISMEDKMIMQLLPALLNKNSQQQQLLVSPSAAADHSMKLPYNLKEDQIRALIKSGQITKEIAKSYLKNYGATISDQEFEDKWKELSE